jgi:serine/threonine-protein kinase
MRLRRHTEPGFTQSPRGRRLVRDFALLLGVFIVGYGLAYLWLAPKRLFGADHAVPRLLELSQRDAEARLARLKLTAEVTGERQHVRIGRGNVVWQDPAPGTILPEGAAVRLTLSAGIAQQPVPDVAGLAAPQALRVLQAAGFRVETDSAPAGVDPVPSGIVIATRPGAGTARAIGSSVGMVVTR